MESGDLTDGITTDGIDDRRSPLLNAAGRKDVGEWRQFFSQYSHVVLVANSEDQKFDAIRRELPDTALYVFFNKIDKVLREPFTGHSLIVTRSNGAGSELVYRNILDRMTAMLPSPRFAGVMNLRAVAFEHLHEIEEFGATPAGLLDLAPYFETFYPADHTASSGFALAVWLCEMVPDPKVMLTGFSAQRGRRWKLFHIHDWTFEQTVLRILATSGKLENDRRASRNSYTLLRQHFPDLSPEQVSFGVAQILSERLEASNRHIDKLISITMPLRAIYNGMHLLKRKSKKDRVIAKRAKQEKS